MGFSRLPSILCYTALAIYVIAIPFTSLSAKEVKKLPVGIVKEKPKSGRFVKCDQGYMVPYKTKIPGTDIAYEMVPIPGETFLLGSPKEEKGREACEGPQVKVTIKSFWMGKYEVTWGEYQLYMDLLDDSRMIEMLRRASKIEPKTENEKKKYAAIKKIVDKNPALKKLVETKTNKKSTNIVADAITAPSRWYNPDKYIASGENPNLPAVGMRQYSAKQYTKYLSKLTGNFYRLPGEAEWEYAARAGTKTRFHFGDDISKLDKYAWYKKNSKEKAHKVGLKKPNQWGLHDMHGNVAEWVLDGFDKNGYKKHQGKIYWSKKEYPRVVRGGGWLYEAVKCRSASRLGSDDSWNDLDPSFPSSPWWFSSKPLAAIGFRIVRPLHTPQKSIEQEKYWKADTKSTVDAVEDRIKIGHGRYIQVNQQLPSVIKSLNKIRKIE